MRIKGRNLKSVGLFWLNLFWRETQLNQEVGEINYHTFAIIILYWYRHLGSITFYLL